ncbi:MAG: hypothetical protein A2269_01230 [Lentisphaerae bacterium RIFOXYA12_FULL_60_10]|nr:MAG: hypothetical protein A2269_01230 [Lentisphaerae bacterium RIFOXYA12_FULL_60_10]
MTSCFWRSIFARRELLWLLMVRNLTIRYKHSVLGFFWSLLGPLLMILIYAVFAHILRFQGSHPAYLPFLVSGLIVWHYLSLCLNDSLYSIAGSANLIKKTTFPRIILPMAMTFANLLNFLLTLVVLVAYLCFAGQTAQHILWLPLLILTQTALCLGLALVLSSLNVFFRDTEHLLGVGVLAWFFLTPVFYPLGRQLDMLPEYLHWMPFLNPMTGIVSSYRFILISDPLPMMLGLFISGGISWVLLLFGAWLFQRLQIRFGDTL